jgi:hypothetical protein
MKKTSKDEWFAAASAQDYWAMKMQSSTEPTIEKHGANGRLFTALWFEACDMVNCGLIPNGAWDTAFLAAQIGCEKAGL